METPKIVHPITTSEFGFYQIYFTISNVNFANPLTPKALEVISLILSENKSFLTKKRFKHDLALKLNVKTPRIYKILSELEDKALLINQENHYALAKGLGALQDNVKYLLNSGQTQFNYDMLFNIENGNTNLNN